jgi:ArsR family transcriptional regulator, cadmium/lead-responsive transcriptional repressor
MAGRSDDADRLWAALGDPMRIRVLDLLLERGEATASMLATLLPITRQGVSKHLAVLERDGLVMPHRSGREVRYAVREERLDEARAALARTAARWDTRLMAIKNLAEGASTARTPDPKPRPR